MINAIRLGECSYHGALIQVFVDLDGMVDIFLVLEIFEYSSSPCRHMSSFWYLFERSHLKALHFLIFLDLASH